MVPPKKKQKIVLPPAPLPPIVFNKLGMKADTRFFVFGKEFHVNSVVLEANSGFFRTFLKPSGGVVPTSTSPSFKSDWFTKIDTDGAWALTADHDSLNASNFHGDSLHEEAVFQKFLCALYGRSYHIKTCDEMVTLTELASYYCCRLVVSQSLFGVFHESPRFQDIIYASPCEMLQCAFKLRHTSLFRECFIHVLGPWSNPQYHNLPNGELKDLACKANTNMALEIAEVHMDLLRVVARHTTDPKKDGESILAGSLAICAKDSLADDDRELLLPKYLRKCFRLDLKACGSSSAKDKMYDILEPFMYSNLTLDKTGAKAGLGVYGDYFLGYDTVMPWDETKDDWE